MKYISLTDTKFWFLKVQYVFPKCRCTNNISVWRFLPYTSIEMAKEHPHSIPSHSPSPTVLPQSVTHSAPTASGRRT